MDKFKKVIVNPDEAIGKLVSLLLGEEKINNIHITKELASLSYAIKVEYNNFTTYIRKKIQFADLEQAREIDIIIMYEYKNFMKYINEGFYDQGENNE